MLILQMSDVAIIITEEVAEISAMIIFDLKK
jgi:hypothetical protein